VDGVEAPERESGAPGPPDRWRDALRAVALLAVDPAGLGGISVAAGHGPVRERLLTVARELMPQGSPWRRVPIHAGDERLLGGLDLGATLRAGRPVADPGLLAEADGGTLVLAMAERVAPAAAARLCAALDAGERVLARDGLQDVRPTRFGLIALDEGVADDPPPAPALLERLAFRVDLAEVPWAAVVDEAGPTAAGGDSGTAALRARVAAARGRADRVEVDDRVLQALCGTALALGVGSARAGCFALRAARASAALDGRDRVDDSDAALAARLVLAPRATRWPEPPAATHAGDAEPPQRDDDATRPAPEADAARPPGSPGSPETPEPPAQAGGDTEPTSPPDATRALDDVVLEAARAAIPAGLLAGLALAAGLSGPAGAGRAGAVRVGRLRGRPAGSRPGRPRDGARLALIDSLRAAAPWQPIRRREAAGRAAIEAGGAGSTRAGEAPRLSLRVGDLRVSRRRERSETTTVFAIDASGSSALHRLAEAKGAVELLLADCYVRRDRVAVVAFRGRGADTLLSPTRSLVRARRSLVGLPGGGGTPLAAGIDAAAAVADAVARRGGSPLVVLLTDGRANVARDGAGGREQATFDAIDAARRLRAAAHPALLVDTSPQPQPSAQALATAMGATYVPLPRADARSIAQPVRAAAAAASRAAAGAAPRRGG
jgi:magnesium chelatase subunit D